MSWGSCGDAETPLPQATLLVSILWMPALLPLASRLLLLPRALQSMASRSPPSQSSPASGSGYIPGSVSAAFVTCPNEKVAKEIARWGPTRESWARGRVLPRRVVLDCRPNCRPAGRTDCRRFTLRAVVEKRLAACVNLIPQISSM